MGRLGDFPDRRGAADPLADREQLSFPRLCRQTRRGRSRRQPAGFLIAQLADHAGLFALAAIAGLFGPFRSLRKPSFKFAGPQPFAARFLVTFALGPVLLSVLRRAHRPRRHEGYVGDADVQPLRAPALGLVADRFTEASLRRLVVGAAVLLIVVPLGYAASVLFAGSYMKKPLGVNWPQAAMSTRFSDIWRGEVHRPLGIVAGDVWTAGLVALTASDKPSIFTGANPTLAPWITPERLAREGALVVWRDKGVGPPPELAAFIGQAAKREEAFAWPRSGGPRAIADRLRHNSASYAFRQRRIDSEQQIGPRDLAAI